MKKWINAINCCSVGYLWAYYLNKDESKYIYI